MSDAYSSYEAGLQEFMGRIKRSPVYQECLVFEGRLRENIAECRLYGNSDVRKADRFEIIARLNEIALSSLGVSFNELCAAPATPSLPAPAARPQHVLAAVARFFDEDEWPYTEVEGQPILRTAFSGKSGSWNCFAHVREEQFRFTFYSVCANKTAEARRPAMAEFLTRANYGLIIGNFELDYGDGEVRYKASIDVEGAELTSALIRQMVYANVLTFDKYLPGIMKVMYADAEPAEVIAEIEGPAAEPAAPARRGGRRKKRVSDGEPRQQT